MDSCPNVAELQGLYGVFGFPERLLQQIWSRSDFDRAGTVLADGRPILISDPGRWNLLGGPDFRDARLAIADGPARTGDVELHLHADDWKAHNHAADPAYDRVILHVVLFPPPPGHHTCGAGDAEIPVLPLLTVLPRDLESYAADAVVEQLADRPLGPGFARLAALSPAELDRQLRHHAEARWRQKVGFARIRLARLGWEAACHHGALEVLGHRFNRAPMLRIAGRFPLGDWRLGRVDAARAFASESDRWIRQGGRPANHPRLRLGQYHRWVAARPGWPEAAVPLLQSVLAPGPHPAPGDDARHLRARLCADAVPAARFNTICCDALLPLLAAHLRIDPSDTWFRWPPGDIPFRLRRPLAALRSGPGAHGRLQGLLGWLAASSEPS